eukprot:scpid26910/ scgid3449/ 
MDPRKAHTDYRPTASADNRHSSQLIASTGERQVLQEAYSGRRGPRDDAIRERLGQGGWHNSRPPTDRAFFPQSSSSYHSSVQHSSPLAQNTSTATQFSNPVKSNDQTSSPRLEPSRHHSSQFPPGNSLPGSTASSSSSRLSQRQDRLSTHPANHKSNPSPPVPPHQPVANTDPSQSLWVRAILITFC